MVRYMTKTAHVPRGFGSVTLRPGDEVPEWAEDAVGNHATSDSPPAPAPVEPTVSVEPEPVPDTGPGESWTNAQIRDYAEEHNIDLGGATVKADMLVALAGN